MGIRNLPTALLYCLAMTIAMPARVIIVRHGATDWSMVGKHTGRSDIALNDVGRQQSRRLRPFLERIITSTSAYDGDDSARQHADDEPVVFTSTLSRASETAALALPARFVDRAGPIEQLVEIDYGRFEGLTSPEIALIDPAWNLYTDGCPGGESVAAVIARCDSFIAKTERMAAGRTVVVFTHGHFSRVLTARLLGQPASLGSTLYNDTATIAVVDERRGFPVLTAWNLGAH